MNLRKAFQETLLTEGLEANIPLPEIAETCLREGHIVGGDDGHQELADALTRLLRDGRIKVLVGPWADPEPRVVTDSVEAAMLLGDLRQYTYDHEEEFDLERVYYVNSANFSE